MNFAPFGAWRLAALLFGTSTVLPAAAHDTWFVREAATPAGHAAFALGTGDRFPVVEFPLAFDAIVGSGCVAAGEPLSARPVPLVHVEDRPTLLRVRSAQPLPSATAFSCWAQVKAFDVVVPPDKVELYLREIQAGPALRATWAAMRSRGLPWRERYTKSARVEHAGSGLRPALPLQMDARLETGAAPPRAGDEVTVQVLRQGRPVAGLPVEFVSHRSPIGLWRQTDAEGRVRTVLPLAARWLVRAVDLRVDPGDADAWESDFVTLAFEVGPR